ncbi:hypothetical protein OAM24_01095 [Candidatus Pelagibacter ubique]|nr:hypothetical protein [Candidatus Pelagibacter ubique]
MNKKDCVVIFNNSWGEVDFILPILKKLNEKGYRIFSSFKTKSFFEKKIYYKDLYKLLKQFTTVINVENSNPKFSLLKIILNYILRPKFLFYKFKSFKFSKINTYIDSSKSQNSESHINFLLKNKIDVDFILCADFDSDYYLWIKNFKKRFFLFPHALTLRGDNLNVYRNIDKKFYSSSFKRRFDQLKKFPNGTKLFACNKDELNYFSKFTPKNINLNIIGFPRLTDDWIKYIHSKIQKKYLITKYKKNILLVIGKVSYLGAQEIKKKIIDIIKIAELFDYNIIVKNHPRNKFNLKIFTNYSKKIIIKEGLHSISSILKFCDIMIVTSKTGVCLEGVFQDKIVIEYYKYGRKNLKNNVYEYKINEDYFSIYKLYKLAYSCSSYISLKNVFCNLETNKNFKKKLLMLQNNGMKKINFENNQPNYKSIYN